MLGLKNMADFIRGFKTHKGFHKIILSISTALLSSVRPVFRHFLLDFRDAFESEVNANILLADM